MSNEPLGYKTGVKSAIVTSLRALYPKNFLWNNDREVNVSIDYPMTEGEYPCIFVEFEDGTLSSTGIGGFDERSELDEDDQVTLYRRWKFTGSIVYSFFALKAKECDLLSDGFVKAVGFSDAFKNLLRDNEYIAIDAQTQSLSPIPMVVAPGTPWGSNDPVYYAGYRMTVQGEFFTDTLTAGIIERIESHPRLEAEPDLPDDTEGAWT